MSGRGGGRGRGKKFGHKGQAKHFTNEDDIRRQNEEFRKQKEAEADNEEESSGEEKEENANAGKKVTVNTAANKQKEISDESDSSSESDEEDGGRSGVQGLIEVSNPNRVKSKMKKLKDLSLDDVAPKTASGPQALNRKEREAMEAEQKKAAYMRLHAQGKTEEAKNDMARLAIIRKQREEAAKKAEADKKAKEAKTK